MFIQGISKETKNCLALLAGQEFIGVFYLSGGSGCALHMAHRLSFDLDFFSSEDFNTNVIRKKLQDFGRFSLTQEEKNTLLGELNNIKVSFFTYKYPLLFKTKEFSGIRIADLLDIACMKLDAIASRGTKRDFVDLYFICQDKKNNLNSLMRLYQKKYEIKNMFHLLKSLTYFVDADEHEMPKMLKPCKWDEVKFFFESKVKKIVLPRPKVARVK